MHLPETVKLLLIAPVHKVEWKESAAFSIRVYIENTMLGYLISSLLGKTRKGVEKVGLPSFSYMFPVDPDKLVIK